MTPEFSRPERVDRLPSGAAIRVEANAAERAALARRFALPGIGALRGEFSLTSLAGGVVQATASLHALVTQIAADTDEPLERVIEEAFEVHFVPAGRESATVDLDRPDEIPYEGGVIDLGEATAEQLALALDPFPRARPD